MRVQISGLMGILVIMAWLAGIVLSKGFWLCLFAMIIPPYAWYLVVEKIMLMNGWLQ